MAREKGERTAMSGRVKEGRKGMSGSEEEGGGKNRAREERMSIMMREKRRVHKFLDIFIPFTYFLSCIIISSTDSKHKRRRRRYSV